MNFADEHYVRIYTRDTKTWLRWGWEGQVVFALTARKLNALGCLSVDDAGADVALLTGLPEEVVRVGLGRLLASRTFVISEGVLECPNWIDGQTGSKSDSARSRAYRARLKAQLARAHSPGPDVSRASRVATHDGAPNTAVSQPPQVVTPPAQSVAPPSRVDTPASIPSQPIQDQIRSEREIQNLTGSVREEPAPPLPAVWFTLDGWDPPQWLIDDAAMQGIPKASFERRLADLRTGPIGGKRGVLNRDDYVRAQLSKWRMWDEQERVAARANSRDSVSDQARKLPGLTGAAARKALEEFE